MRETLFNWLQAIIPGARCLDLFAGSGALGIEAASRGAAEVVLIENNPVVLRHLRTQVVSFDADDGLRVVSSDAFRYLAECAHRFDVVFIDPPFGCGLASQACRSLADNALLTPGASVYVETGADEPTVILPPGWTWHRQTRMGHVCLGLARSPDTQPEGNGGHHQRGTPNGHEGNLSGNV